MQTLLAWTRHDEVSAIGMYQRRPFGRGPWPEDVHRGSVRASQCAVLEYVRTFGKEQQVIRAQQASKESSTKWSSPAGDGTMTQSQGRERW